MKPLAVFLTLLLFILFSSPSFSQTVAAPDDVQLMVEYLDAEVNQDPHDPNYDLSRETIRVTLIVQIPDGQSIARFKVTAGTTPGGDNLRDVNLNNDGSNLPAGTTVRRDGNTAFLCLGEFTGTSAVYADVSLEDALGNRSTATRVSF